MIAEVTLNTFGHDFKVKVKLYNTNCSIQIQEMGNSELFLKNMKLTTAEYLANLIVEFANEVFEKNPEHVNKFLPDGLDEEIEQMEKKKKSEEKMKKKVPLPSYRRIFDKSKKSLMGFACNECIKKTKLESDMKVHIKENHKKKPAKIMQIQTEVRFSMSPKNEAGDCN